MAERGELRPPAPRTRGHGLGHVYRWGTTPTPAPVTVSLEPASAPPPGLTSTPRPAAPRRARRARSSLLLGVTVSVVAALLLAHGSSASRASSAHVLAAAPASVASPSSSRAAASPAAPSHFVVTAAPSVSSAPASARRHQPIEGGVVLAPSSLADDGSYDLIVHFHGHAAAVEQSVAYAGLGAALAVLNLGRGARVYRRPFESAAAFEELVQRIDEVVAGSVAGATHPRRIALSSHSAGCGALDAILARHLDDPRLDAVLVSDGIYGEFSDPAHTEIDPASLRTFARAAKRAAASELLFSISHSMIDPYDAAGPARTARYLLVQAGGRVEPQAMLPAPAPAMLEAVELRVPAAHRLVPVHDSRIGELRVRGYQGTERADHEAQLLQMAATVLPDLVERWSPP